MFPNALIDPVFTIPAPSPLTAIDMAPTDSSRTVMATTRTPKRKLLGRASKIPFRAPTPSSTSNTPRYVPTNAAKVLGLGMRQKSSKSPGQSPLGESAMQLSAPTPTANVHKELPSPPFAHVINQFSPAKAQRTLIDAAVVGTPTEEEWPVLQPENVTPKPQKTKSIHRTSALVRDINSSSMVDFKSTARRDAVDIFERSPEGTPALKNDTPSPEHGLHGFIKPPRNIDASPLVARSQSLRNSAANAIAARRVSYVPIQEGVMINSTTASPMSNKRFSSLPAELNSSHSLSHVIASPGPNDIPVNHRSSKSCISKNKPAPDTPSMNPNWPLPDGPLHDGPLHDGPLHGPVPTINLPPKSIQAQEPISRPSFSTTSRPSTSVSRDNSGSRVKRISIYDTPTNVGATLTLADDASAVILGPPSPPQSPKSSTKKPLYERSINILTARISRSRASQSYTCTPIPPVPVVPAVPELQKKSDMLSRKIKAKRSIKNLFLKTFWGAGKGLLALPGECKTEREMELEMDQIIGKGNNVHKEKTENENGNKENQALDSNTQPRNSGTVSRASSATLPAVSQTIPASTSTSIAPIPTSFPTTGQIVPPLTPQTLLVLLQSLLDHLDDLHTKPQSSHYYKLGVEIGEILLQLTETTDSALRAAQRATEAAEEARGCVERAVGLLGRLGVRVEGVVDGNRGG